MIDNYNKFIKLIKEGLIKTYNIEKYHRSLEIELTTSDIEYKLNIESKFKFIIEFINVDKLIQQQLDVILPIVNNLGYYPSYITVVLQNGMKNLFKFNEKYLSNKYKSFEIIFEAKYEDGLYKNDLEIPDKAYHLTRQIYKEKIEINGLYPKRKNRKGNHLERIYMFYDINNYKSLLKTLKLNDILRSNKNTKTKDNGNYMLLEVKLTDKNIIHTDPNYSDGFYTTDNIPYNNIEIIKENL